MFINIKRRSSKQTKNRFGVLFASVCFVAKMRLAVNRFRKRKQLVRQWVDLQKSSLLSIEIIKQKTKQLQFSQIQSEIILQGLQSVQDSSRKNIQKLTNILTQKHIIFEEAIIQVSTRFEQYSEYMKRYVQRLITIKQHNQESAGRLLEEDNRLILQQNCQKIIYKSYQVAIIIAKYLKYISINSKDYQYFLTSQSIITNINKKFDQLIGQSQKSKQLQRLQRMIGYKINSPYIYTDKCFWHMGQIVLHVFQLVIIIEEGSKLTSIKLDKYCTVFIKFYEKLRVVCLVTNDSTVHFLFNFSKQLTRFVKIVRNNILEQGGNIVLSSLRIPYLFNPFLSAKIVDCRQGRDKKIEYIIIFSSLGQRGAQQDRSFQRSIVRQSNLNWTEVGYYQQHQQFNEEVTLTINELLKIKKTCQSQYGVKLQLPKLLNFSNKVSDSCLNIFQWQTYLNNILRSKIIINNPILLLKQLHITDIFLQASLSKSNLPSKQGSKQHCTLCSKVVITSLNRYFSQRLHFISKKYNSRSKEYCYYIFQKIRQEICQITVSKLNTCKELITWRQFRNGTIDYAFRKFVQSEKYYFVQVGMLQVRQQSYEVQINQHTLASQVIDQVCLLMREPVLAGYRLVIYVQEQEIILRSNQLIFQIVQAYNISYKKSYSSTFLSKIKSFGRALQLSQRGILVLKQIIYYPLSEAQQAQRYNQNKQSAFLFKQDRLIGISKDSKFQIITLYSIKELLEKGKELTNNLSSIVYQKYTPCSVQQQVESFPQQIQKFYNQYKNSTISQLQRIIESKLSISQLYRKYVISAKIVETSGLLSQGKSVKNVLIGIGWKDVVVLTLNEKLIARFKWEQLMISLGVLGINLSNEKNSFTFKCPQLYEIYEVLLQYKALTEQIIMIKSK